ncbi:Fanconi anemia group E protein isoform X3 [Pleurodeles waltl]|uniref:Fanconi anemia group E protein isoform X3 n=2 Tax=Pleurodeles waltl TaxID=8319 RepID=UPI003709A117
MEEQMPLWLEPFDKPSRLLLNALMSGPSGSLIAARTLQRIQSSFQGTGQEPFDWMSLTRTLCREEPSLEGPEKKLTIPLLKKRHWLRRKQRVQFEVFSIIHKTLLSEPPTFIKRKPLFLLLPLMCQRNLLRFLLVVHPPIPKDCLSKVIEAVGRATSLDPWIMALRALLQRDLGRENSSPPLHPLTNQCQQQLRDLCRGITNNTEGRLGTDYKLGCYRDFWQKQYCRDTEKPTGPEFQNLRKRKYPGIAPDSPPWDPEDGQQAKKSRTAQKDQDIDLFEGLSPEHTTDSNVAAEEGTWDTEIPPSKNQTGAIEGHASQTQPSQARAMGRPLTQSQSANLGQLTLESGQSGELPESLKLRVSRLKELLETEGERPDVLISAELQVLNECDSAQLDVLCSLLHVSQLSEQALVQFCTELQSLCPDLSYRNAAVLSKHLFLHRVLLLTEPASRLLITALTLFSSKYAHATCSALIGPLLLTPEKGPVLVEFLCRIIEECLELNHLILVISEILEAPWSEDVIAVLHSLLERGVELPSGTFDLLIQKLSQWSPKFIKSMKFAKLMLNLLTKYQNHIQMSHHKSLSSALALNETFLKKSLQAALKRLLTS